MAESEQQPREARHRKAVRGLNETLTIGDGDLRGMLSEIRETIVDEVAAKLTAVDQQALPPISPHPTSVEKVASTEKPTGSLR